MTPMITNDAIAMSKRVAEVQKIRASRMPVLKEFPYNKIGSYKNSNPYVIAFVYPKNGKPGVVKGGYNDVSMYLRNNLAPCFVHQTMWHHGAVRTNYAFVGFAKRYAIHLISPAFAIHRAKEAHREGRRYDKPIRWQLTVMERNGVYLRNGGAALFESFMKKPPRSWIKELDPYIA